MASRFLARTDLVEAPCGDACEEQRWVKPGRVTPRNARLFLAEDGARRGTSFLFLTGTIPSDEDGFGSWREIRVRASRPISAGRRDYRR
jgi:hypothetical protein